MICRLCLGEREEIFPFFDLTGKKTNIAIVVSKHFWFKLRPDDPISNVICNDCWVKVANFDDFYRNVEKSEKEFQEGYLTKFGKSYNSDGTDSLRILSNNSDTHEEYSDTYQEYSDMIEREIPIDITNTIMDVGKPIIQMDMIDAQSDIMIDKDHLHLNKVKDPIDNETEDNCNDVAVFVNNGMKKVKKDRDEYVKNQEKENVLDVGFCFNGVKCQNLKTEIISDDTCENPDRSDSYSSHDKCNKESTRKIKLKRGRPRKEGKVPDSEESIERLKCYQAKSAQSDAEIAQYMSLHCELCNMEMERFTSLKIHMRIKHKVIGYVKCCDKKFLKRQLLLEHIRKHLNPDCYKCDDCNRVFSDKQSMRNHFLVKHQKEEDKIFKCCECSKKFARKYLLEQHKAYAHTDRSTTCKRCNRRFSTVEDLNVHNRVRCFGTMCEVCAKVIRGSKAFQRHQAEHMGIALPKVQCEECGSWHKDKYALTKHKKRHVQAKETYVCNLCQKVTPNRPALLSHISFVHDIRRSFECNICNKSFKKAIYLREHMAGHTGEVLYRCPHCPKTFNSNANMHSHRKKMHPQEFEEMRKLRQQSAHLPIPPIPSIAEMSRKKNASISDIQYENPSITETNIVNTKNNSTNITSQIA